MLALNCQPKKVNRWDYAPTDRQERFSWWNQNKIEKANILVVGDGGIGSNQTKIYVQAGVGGIHGVDFDLVEHSNRNRQLFTAEDVGKPKAHQVLKNVAPYAVYRTRLRGYFMTFEQFAEGKRNRYDIIACGVDSFPTMVAVARYGLKTNTPVVFTNISADGESLRIFIQRPGSADPCFGCYFPQALKEPRRNQPCAPVPAIADILQAAVGFGARAVFGEILGTPIGDYHSRDITFTGFDIKKTIEKRPSCSICGGLGQE